MYIRRTLKNYFVPHSKNNYHPYILHTKRAVFYSLFFLVTKLIVFSFVFLLPISAFTSENVLKYNSAQVVILTNDLRQNLGLPKLVENENLDTSAQNKALDMAQKSYFEHVSPEGKGLKQFLQEVNYDYRFAGENLAVGFFTAERLLDAWVKSPSHYANIIDKDYQEIGIGLAVGAYKNRASSIFAVSHFGTKQGFESSVAGVSEKKTTLFEPIFYNEDKSVLLWQESREGIITLTARAYVAGSVKNIKVEANQYDIELTPTENDGIYVGKISYVGNSDDLFKIILNPIIRITDVNNKVYEHNIFWKNPKIVALTNAEKYQQAKTALSEDFMIFKVSKIIYLFFIVLFVVALFLKIFIELRKQHPHVIFQTLLLISLLVILFEV
ncbi:MAG: CAP domain-containing protein [Candidatus Magasanikbacteria bacterium]